jgi:hypothetical protein
MAAGTINGPIFVRPQVVIDFAFEGLCLPGRLPCAGPLRDLVRPSGRDLGRRHHRGPGRGRVSSGPELPRRRAAKPTRWHRLPRRQPQQLSEPDPLRGQLPSAYRPRSAQRQRDRRELVAETLDDWVGKVPFPQELKDFRDYLEELEPDAQSLRQRRRIHHGGAQFDRSQRHAGALQGRDRRHGHGVGPVAFRSTHAPEPPVVSRSTIPTSERAVSSKPTLPRRRLVH